MKLAIIKNEKRKPQHIINEVIDTLPDNHIFSDTELQLFNIVQIDDLKVETINKEIENYHKTAVITGSTPLPIKKYYDGELKWQTV